MIALLGLALAGPDLVSNRVWSSSFEAEGARPHFVELQHEGLAVEVGTSDDGLRIFLEESPGEPWRGPLSVMVDGVLVSWPEASTPRSVPDKTIYEASFEGPPRGTLVFVDGPAAELQLELPGERKRLAWAWIGLSVLAVWGVGRLAQRVN